MFFRAGEPSKSSEYSLGDLYVWRGTEDVILLSFSGTLVVVGNEARLSASRDRSLPGGECSALRNRGDTEVRGPRVPQFLMKETQ